MNIKQIHEKMMHSIHQKETVDGVAEKCINSTLNQYEIYGNSEQAICGDNLISTALSLTEQTLNGITCIKEEDGSYTFSGVSTAQTTFRSVLKTTNRQLFKAGIYYIPKAIDDSNCSLGLNFYTAPSGGNLVQVSPGIGGRNFELEQNLYLSQWYLYFHGGAGTEYNFNFFPQITRTDTTEYIPYVTKPTPDNPSEIISVGDKVLDEYNTDNISLWLDGELNTRNGHNTSSTKWEDLSGNNFDFTINNLDATFNDYALNFAHKGNSGAVSCTADILGTSKSITIEVCSHLLTNDTNYYWIFSNRTENKGFQILNMINVDNYKDKSAFRQTLFFNGNTSDYMVTSGITRDRSDTYPITYQAITIEENRIKFYIDGELVQKYNKTLTDEEWGYLRQKVFYIGKFGSGYYYFGDIHSIRVHQQALTDGQLKRNAEIDLNRFNNKISATKYEIPISISGNLLKFKAISNTANGLTYDLTEDGILTLNGTTTSSVSFTQNFTNADKLLKGKYSIRIFKEGTITGWGGFGGVFNCFESNDNTDRFIYVNSKLSQNIYLSQDRLLKKIVIYFYPNVTFDNVKLKIMLVKGEAIPDEFIPYTKPETRSIYLSEPLRSIGEYKDCIDFRSGKVYRNVSELVLTGEENFTTVSTSNENKFYRFQMTKEQIVASGISDWSTQKCNYYIGTSITTTNTNVGISIYYSSANNCTYCRVRDNDNFPTVDDFLAFLKEKYAEGNPLVVYYQSYRTITEDINLPRLPQFKGTTYYSIDTDIPSEFVGTYKYKN